MRVRVRVKVKVKVNVRLNRAQQQPRVRHHCTLTPTLSLKGRGSEHPFAHGITFRSFTNCVVYAFFQSVSAFSSPAFTMKS